MKRPLWLCAWVLACGLAGAASVDAGCAAPAPKLAQAEGDLCAARAVWKAFAAANNLAPEPGSARAKLEAAEDALCAVRAESNP